MFGVVNKKPGKCFPIYPWQEFLCLHLGKAESDAEKPRFWSGPHCLTLPGWFSSGPIFSLLGKNSHSPVPQARCQPLYITRLTSVLHSSCTRVTWIVVILSKSSRAWRTSWGHMGQERVRSRDFSCTSRWGYLLVPSPAGIMGKGSHLAFIQKSGRAILW